MGDDQLSSVKDAVEALVQAARTFAKYPAGHPRRGETFELFAVRATAFGERWGDLRLDFEKRGITALGATVWTDKPEHPPVLGAALAAGVKAVTLGSGVAREELQPLVEVF